MKCPFCGSNNDKVIDSRSSNAGQSVRRRRECVDCEKRFTTYEYVEEIPLMVVKKDGRRESFERKKLIAGLIKACEKRPIPIETIEDLVDKIERQLQRNFEKEVDSNKIGELVMKYLFEIDEIAYVRFASVYRQFRDVSQFMKELKKFLK
ncbi:MAG: transcriptional regulator NrdR [Candidatus Omnitrophica bacterium]|nr:transcriptional regulator NrdR [Candidatus Omnitrophota bacterium]